MRINLPSAANCILEPPPQADPDATDPVARICVTAFLGPAYGRSSVMRINLPNEANWAA